MSNRDSHKGSETNQDGELNIGIGRDVDTAGDFTVGDNVSIGRDQNTTVVSQPEDFWLKTTITTIWVSIVAITFLCAIFMYLFFSWIPSSSDVDGFQVINILRSSPILQPNGNFNQVFVLHEGDVPLSSRQVTLKYGLYFNETETSDINGRVVFTIPNTYLGTIAELTTNGFMGDYRWNVVLGDDEYKLLNTQPLIDDN